MRKGTGADSARGSVQLARTVRLAVVSFSMALQIVCDASDYAPGIGSPPAPPRVELRHYRTETLTHNSLALTGQDPTRRVDELVPSRRRPDRELTLSPIFRDLADPRAAPRHSYEEKVERDPFRSLANHSPSPSWPIFVPAHGLLLHKPGRFSVAPMSWTQKFAVPAVPVPTVSS